MNSGTRGAFQYILDSKDSDLEIVGIGDFGGDTKSDLLWERTSTGAKYITLMNSGTRGAFQYIKDSKDSDLEIIEP